MTTKKDILLITSDQIFHRKFSDFLELLDSRSYTYDLINPATDLITPYNKENYYGYKLILINRPITSEESHYLKLIDFLKNGGDIFSVHSALGLFGESDEAMRSFYRIFFSSRYQEELLFDFKDYLEIIESLVIKRENIKDINDSNELQEIYKHVEKIVLFRPIRICPKHTEPKILQLINTNPSTQLEDKMTQLGVTNIGSKAICGFIDHNMKGRFCFVSGISLKNDLFNCMDNRVFISNILSYLLNKY